MELTKNEFDILTYLLEKRHVDQKDISKNLDLTVEAVNDCITSLKEKGFIDDGHRITSDGSAVLKQYQVKRAIIMAAGFGSRMVPVTLTTPKPLVKVNGIRIIDRLIDALLEKGIAEIIVVRG